MPMHNGNSGRMGDMGETKMHDMSEMREQPTAPGEDAKEEKYYPTTYLSSKKLPGIEKYDIGDECKIVSLNKVVGKREKEDGVVEVEVEIRESGIDGEKKISKEEYMDLPDEEKDKVDEKQVLGEDA